MLNRVLDLMNSLIIEQLCSDGLVTDHTMQLIFAHDEDRELHNAAPQTASHPGAQPIQAWPQPNSQQWDNIITVANRACVLYVWLQTLVESHSMSNEQDRKLIGQLMLSVSKLLASLLAGGVLYPAKAWYLSLLLFCTRHATVSIVSCCAILSATHKREQQRYAIVWLRPPNMPTFFPFVVHASLASFSMQASKQGMDSHDSVCVLQT